MAESNWYDKKTVPRWNIQQSGLQHDYKFVEIDQKTTFSGFFWFFSNHRIQCRAGLWQIWNGNLSLIFKEHRGTVSSFLFWCIFVFQINVELMCVKALILTVQKYWPYIWEKGRRVKVVIVKKLEEGRHLFLFWLLPCHFIKRMFFPAAETKEHVELLEGLDGHWKWDVTS